MAWHWICTCSWSFWWCSWLLFVSLLQKLCLLLFSWFQKFSSWRLRPFSSDITVGLAVWPLICFSAICSAGCRGVAQTATFLLSLGLCLATVHCFSRSCKITPALAFLVSVNLILASEVILLWIVVSPTISFSLFGGLFPLLAIYGPLLLISLRSGLLELYFCTNCACPCCCYFEL